MIIIQAINPKLIHLKKNLYLRFLGKREKQLIKFLKVLSRTSRSLWRNAVRGFALTETLFLSRRMIRDRMT